MLVSGSRDDVSPGLLAPFCPLLCAVINGLAHVGRGIGSQPFDTKRQSGSQPFDPKRQEDVLAVRATLVQAMSFFSMFCSATSAAGEVRQGGRAIRCFRIWHPAPELRISASGILSPVHFFPILSFQLRAALLGRGLQALVDVPLATDILCRAVLSAGPPSTGRDLALPHAIMCLQAAAAAGLEAEVVADARVIDALCVLMSPSRRPVNPAYFTSSQCAWVPSGFWHRRSSLPLSSDARCPLSPHPVTCVAWPSARSSPSSAVFTPRSCALRLQRQGASPPSLRSW